MQQVVKQKGELQDLVGQMLAAITTTREQLKKADVEVGLEVWSWNMKIIWIGKLRMDTLYFASKIYTRVHLLL